MKRYFLARSDWHAQRLMARIYNGRIEDKEIDNILLSTEQAAIGRRSKMALPKQEEFNVYCSDFRRDKIVRT